MKPCIWPVCLFVLSLGMVGGCQPEGEVHAPTATVTKFEGERDERFVGTWSGMGGNSTYWLEEDGGYRMKSKISTPGGQIDSEGKGKWLVKDGFLLFEDQAKNVSRYQFALEGDALKLDLNGRGVNVAELQRVVEEKGE